MRPILVLTLLAAAPSWARACDPVPTPVRDLDVPRFYADAAGTKVDAGADAAHKRAVEPLTAFLRHVVQDADKAIARTGAKGREDAARCALTWLGTWARGGAWLGTMATKQAEYQRKWDLAGVALAYLKVKPFATAAERSSIEPWLTAWADRARAFFDDPGRTRNNHWYWLGLSLAATALATDSPRYWAVARAIAMDGARDVAANGTLPKELERGARALHYHAFAAVPLVMMAELAAARGEDWYGFADGALHRLVTRTHAGLQTPELFDKLAGTPQERPVSAQSGWLPLYLARFPARLAGPHPAVARSHRWLGGDVFHTVAAAGHQTRD